MSSGPETQFWTWIDFPIASGVMLWSTSATASEASNTFQVKIYSSCLDFAQVENVVNEIQQMRRIMPDVIHKAPSAWR